MINKADLRWGMAGNELTPSKSNGWTLLSPCQLNQGGCLQQYIKVAKHFQMLS
jgi:hypothetical protein